MLRLLFPLDSVSLISNSSYELSPLAERQCSIVTHIADNIALCRIPAAGALLSRLRSRQRHCTREMSSKFAEFYGSRMFNPITLRDFASRASHIVRNAFDGSHFVRLSAKWPIARGQSRVTIFASVTNRSRGRPPSALV